MRWCRRWIMPLVVLVVLYVVFPPKAHAYLDPGTGSYILQLLIAALVAGLFAVKMYWRRIKAFVTGLFSRENEDEQEQD
jgi:hypothetical protein